MTTTVCVPVVLACVSTNAADSPLGRADFTRFDSSVGTGTLFEEPLLQEIAARTRPKRSVAQVLLRWQLQLGIPTQARTISPSHMQENLDVAAAAAAASDDWRLSDADMAAIGSMQQCNVTRGNPYLPGDHEYATHGNVIGPTPTC